MTSQLYMDLQIKEFREYGYITFSNAELLPEYELELKRRKLEYRVVQGLGEHALTQVICAPDQHQKHLDHLAYEILELEKVLKIKKSFLEE